MPIAHPPSSDRKTSRRNPIWSVNRIVDKGTNESNNGGATLYKVHWNTTTLDRSELSLRDDGTSYAIIDAQEVEIEDLHPLGGGLVKVHWQDSWHRRADLSTSAGDLIDDFEAGVLPPQTQEGLIPAVMPFCSFTPETSTHDYTESFVAQLEAEFLLFPDCWKEDGKAGKRRGPIWATYLAHPTRNRIVFRKRFVERRNTVKSAGQKHRRILAIHRTGNAMVTVCGRCKDGEGAWRRCVVDRYGTALNSACTNCYMAGQMAKCSLSGRNRVDCSLKVESKRPMEAGLEVVEANAPVPKKRKLDAATKHNPPEKSLLRNTAASIAAMDKRSEPVANSSPSSLPWWSGAWDDTYVSNSIGGPAEWSSPINASRRAERIDETPAKSDQRRNPKTNLTGTPLADRTDQPADTQDSSPVCLNIPNQAPSRSPSRPSPRRRMTAEQCRRNLLAQFRASASPAREKKLQSSPPASSSARRSQHFSRLT